MAFSSFQIALTGMKSTQNGLAVIGNNISNVNTNGFKGSRYEFQSMLTEKITSNTANNVGTTESGRGVSGSSFQLMHQGALEPTGDRKDMAIQGDGFFIVNKDDRTEYTRTGHFRPKLLGDKVVLTDDNNGFALQGWNAQYPFSNEGPTINTDDTVGNIELGLGTLERGRTSNFITITGNLDASEKITSTENILNSIPLIDSAGAPASDTTDIKDLVSSQSPTNDLLFKEIDSANGKIEVKLFKGDTSITETFTYGTDGTTLGDFANWLSNAIGATKPTDPTAPFQPSGVTINNGVLSIGTGLGENNKIREVELVYQNDNESANILNFTEELDDSDIKVSSTGLIFVDSEGKEHQIDVTFTKSSYAEDGTVWSYNLESDENFKATGTRLIDSGTIKFDLEGQITSFSPNVVSANFLDDTGASQSQVLNLDFNGITQFASTLGTELDSKHDGFPKGLLVDYYIGENGLVIGEFDNGYTEEIAQIAMATFVSSENLGQTVDGNWDVAEGVDVFISKPLDGKAGQIQSGFLENSNIDLTDEFTKLIINQRSFQSSSNALQVSNEILRNLANLGV